MVYMSVNVSYIFHDRSKVYNTNVGEKVVGLYEIKVTRTMQ